MHRMIFEDFKLHDIHLTFACPKIYHDAIRDHPFLDEVVDIDVDVNDYGVWYDTSMVCNRYEMRTAPYVDKHRSDIWSEHCGLNLTKHNMNFRLADEEKEWGKNKIGRALIFAPISAMSGKTLDNKQIQETIDAIDYDVFLLHNKEIPGIKGKQLNDLTLRQFMSVIWAADYVVSVDTAAFHCAGGMGKPLVGIFSWADGKVLGKYFDFTLVQKHRDDGWDCGPCHDFSKCPKLKDMRMLRKPCITELTSKDIVDGIEKMFKKRTILSDAVI